MTDLAKTIIGFIGLGLMGRPMCRNLLKAGISPIVYNRSAPPREELVREGATAVPSPADVARLAEIIVIMVADTAAVEDVLSGPHGLLQTLRPGTLIIDMGTTAVPATRRLAALVEEKGAAYVDAPVSGGTIGAEGGTLTIMVGGHDEAVARAKPVLSVFGSRITHVGGIGAGQVAKAANQVIVGLNIGAVAEALALAKAAGVDPARVREALRGGFADSRILEIHGQRMVEGNFAPGGKCTTQRKDMHQALEFAATLDLDLPATALSRDLYDRLIASGDGDLDHAALFHLFDRTT